MLIIVLFDWTNDENQAEKKTKENENENFERIRNWREIKNKNCHLRY